MQLFPVNAAVVVALLTTLSAAAVAARQSSPKSSDGATQITIVGCVQSEREFRRATGSGTGGGGGFGVGLGDEFVLINAVRAGAPSSSSTRPGSTVNDIAAAESACDATRGGEAFELTGKQEQELARFVGRRVDIVGMLKPGKDAPNGASGTQTRTDTTGLSKLNPWDQDLELQEVEVTSFRAPAQ